LIRLVLIGNIEKTTPPPFYKWSHPLLPAWQGVAFGGDL